VPSHAIGRCLSLRLFGTPVWLHWSFAGVGLGIGVPIGLIGLASGGDVAGTFFIAATMAVAAIVLVHESGHVVFARLLSIEVHGVYLAASGGCCVAGEARHESHELLYSAGGLLAQVLLLAGTGLWLASSDTPAQAPWDHAAAVFTAVNALLLTVNAWPAGGSDGQRVLLVLRGLRAPS
jgi:Zn-dependent protease